MRILIFGISALVLLGGGCTTIPQNVELSAMEKQHLTPRQICEYEVRAAHDRYKNTWELTLNGIVYAGIAELTGDDDEHWVESLAVGAGVGYVIDTVQFEKRVNKCMESNTILENQVEGGDEKHSESGHL